MTLTRQQKRILIEVHPDRHGGDTSRLEKFFAAMKRPSQSKFVRRVCRVCGVRIGGLRTCRTHQWMPASLACLVLMVAGCTVTKPQTPNTKTQTPSGDVRTAVAAPRLRGPAWDAPTNYIAGWQWFEVWATTNLAMPFALKTNTTNTVALFPEQSAEFYKVRTAQSDGQVSEWATTGH